MSKQQLINHEDLIMKKAMEVFCTDALKFFGIKEKVKEIGPTEIVVLDTKNLHMDYTFLMENDKYIHFEFQTTNKGKRDLIRFRAYESLLALQTIKEVVTYVIYSGEIKTPSSQLKTGISEYNIKAVSMRNVDGDIVISNLEEKITNNEDISREELIALTFTPIMGGKLSKVDKIIKSIRILKEIEDDKVYEIESMLYAFADKFLEGKNLDKVKEEISMTKLGKMLREDGRIEGRKEGHNEKAIKDAINFLKLGVSEEIVAKGTELPIEKIRELKKNLLN